jgi:hypothetical protein
MKRQSALQWLVPLIAVLALFAAGIVFFYPGDGSSFSFATVRLFRSFLE